MQLPEDSDRERGQTDHGEGANERAAEPVILLPFIEDDFQTPETNRKQQDPEIVDPALAGGFDPPALFAKRGGIRDQAAGQEKRQETDWNVNEKDPAPGRIVGDPAAQRRPNGRRHHDRDTIKPEGG